MAKKFQVGPDVAQALTDLASFNTKSPTSAGPLSDWTPPDGNPSQPAPVAETSAAVPASEASAFSAAPQERLLAWYRPMQPRTMPRFVWMIMLAGEAAGNNGRINFDACAERLMTTREKVSRALNELVRAGFFSVISTEKENRKIISKTVVLKK